MAECCILWAKAQKGKIRRQDDICGICGLPYNKKELRKLVKLGFVKRYNRKYRGRL